MNKIEKFLQKYNFKYDVLKGTNGEVVSFRLFANTDDEITLSNFDEEFEICYATVLDGRLPKGGKISTLWVSYEETYTMLLNYVGAEK